MKIGFIGLGNMASAMIGGMLGTGTFASTEIIGSARTQETADRAAKKYGIATGTDNVETARQADVLILAVKPVFLPGVISEIKNVVGEDKLVISKVAWLDGTGIWQKASACTLYAKHAGNGWRRMYMYLFKGRLCQGRRGDGSKDYEELRQGKHFARAFDGCLYRRRRQRASVCIYVY